MIRALVWLVIIGAFVYFGSTIKLGDKTFFGHIRAIWHTEEVQDLKHGVQEKAGPAVNRVEKGVHAGINAMRDDGGNGSNGSNGSGGLGSNPAPAHP